MFIFDWIDDIVFLLDLRTYWRIYLSVAFGFLLVLVLSNFFTPESVSVFGIICCIVIPGILGGFWHKAATRDQ